jgi:ribonuclease P/MRP protein subunit POP5
MRLKTLPTLREKERYVIFKVHSENKISYIDIKNALWNSILNWLGEGRSAKANIHIIKNLWDQGKQIGFIRCSPKFVDDLKFSMALIHQIGDERIIFQTLRVSGTIKAGKEKL